jgi:hypothetical protein
MLSPYGATTTVRCMCCRPRGRCQEAVRQIDPGNLDTYVVISRTEYVKFANLLPHAGWPSALG